MSVWASDGCARGGDGAALLGAAGDDLLRGIAHLGAAQGDRSGGLNRRFDDRPQPGRRVVRAAAWRRQIARAGPAAGGALVAPCAERLDSASTSSTAA